MLWSDARFAGQGMHDSIGTPAPQMTPDHRRGLELLQRADVGVQLDRDVLTE
jgi:hypothetical protein